jgi:hypothetical protein
MKSGQQPCLHLVLDIHSKSKFREPGSTLVMNLNLWQLYQVAVILSFFTDKSVKC